MRASKKIDWFRLSNVELTSGIEVFYASKKFRDMPNVHSGILRHALDEYRHSGIFRNFWKEDLESSFESDSIPTPNYILKNAGLANSALDPLENNLFKICAYIYTGEFRAIEFNNDCKDIGLNNEMMLIIDLIEKDELRHAEGVMRYLKNFPLFKYFHYIIKYKTKYFFQKFNKAQVLKKLQHKTISFFARKLLSNIPYSILDFKNEKISLSKSIINARDMA